MAREIFHVGISIGRLQMVALERLAPREGSYRPERRSLSARHNVLKVASICLRTHRCAAELEYCLLDNKPSV